jgi:glycerol uptake facilitator protein
MFRGSMREFSAEMLGTFVLMLFGLGVNAQVTLGKSTAWVAAGGHESAQVELTQYAYGDYLSINFGWGVAVLLGIYVAGGVTGAHINPAVTVALAVRRELPWSKVIPYVSAQMLGAFLASAVIYAVYVESINVVEAGMPQPVQASQEMEPPLPQQAAASAPGHQISTAGIWSTYPREFPDGTTLSNWTGLVDQVVATALLLLCICAIGDARNLAPGANLAPLVIGSIVFMIGISFGSNCGYAINPARDFSPRLFTWMAGWGNQVFLHPNNLWYLVPIVGPIVGGILGVLTYDLLISRFHDTRGQKGGPQDLVPEEQE